jgi:uncharacterized membrane protein
VSFVLGLVLIFVCRVLLAVFLHHLARSIHAATVIAAVGPARMAELESVHDGGNGHHADAP